MKKIYLLSLLLCLQTTIVFGQAKYKLFVKVNTWGVQGTCPNFHKVEFRYSFNSNISLYYLKITDGNIVNDTTSLIFGIDDTPSGYMISGENKYDTYTYIWPTNLKVTHHCKGGNGIEDNRRFVNPTETYKTKSYSKTSVSIPDYGGSLEYSFSPYNLTITSPDNKVLLENDAISINATTGFPADAYTWKYTVLGDDRYMGKIGHITWQNYYNLPASFQGQSAINIKGSDVLGTLFQDIALSGKKIDLQLIAKDKDGNDYVYSHITLNPMLYAPNILLATPQSAKCSDSKTSSVRIKFDRPIGVGRKLQVVNYLNGVGTKFFINQDSLNANNEYELTNVKVRTPFDFRVLGYFLQDGSPLNATYYVNPVTFPYSLTAFPPKLETKLQSTGVYCYGGKDGTLYGQVKGGTSPFTLNYTTKIPGTPITENHGLSGLSFNNWLNDLFAINSLQAGTYKLTTIDKNGCIAMDSVTLLQPASPLVITSRVNTEVTGYGLSNGIYQIKLKGGTTSYPAPILKSSSGALYTGLLTGTANNEFSYTFSSLPAATYTLRAMDNALALHKASIKDSAGCLVKETLTILQPPPLSVAIEQTTIIKCAGDKIATLIAHGKGGKPFATLRPYTYQWSFSQNGIVAYTSLTNQDSIFTLRGAGFYKVLLTDQNNNQITRVYQITQPDFINADIVVKNVTCLNWTDGAITVANIKGGTAPLTLHWQDGETQPSRTNLAAGNYPFTITDAKGCMLNKKPVIKDTLNGITITQAAATIPICYGEATGSLKINIVVDNPPYSILWNTGANTSVLKNIAADTYTVQVTNNKNCIKEARFIVSNPPSIAMDLETQKYICKGQVAAYDLTKPGFKYLWSGPNFSSTSGKVRLTEEGSYAVLVEDTKGCKASNTITVHRVNASVDADFVMPTQVFAGQEVSLVNITNPLLQDNAYWVFDTTNIDVKHMDDAYATLIFKSEGLYKIGLHTKQGNCTEQVEKEVMVKDASFAPQVYAGTTSFIKEFEIRPNPSDGNFEVMIKLQDIASVKLTLVDIYSKGELAIIEQKDQKEYTIPMHVQIAAGTYMLFIETPFGVRVIKVIII